jgi:hypothetical protein
MPRYVESQDRQQVTLLPECLDDFIGEDNPVRVVDAFVDELDLAGLGFRRDDAGLDWSAQLPPRRAAEDLHLRLPQPRTEQQAPGARVPAQCRTDVVDGPSGARLQDHRRLPARQRPRHPPGLQPVRGHLPQAQAACRRRRRRGRQQVQGGQQPRPQLHAAQARTADEADPGEHRPLPGSPGYG